MSEQTDQKTSKQWFSINCNGTDDWVYNTNGVKTLMVFDCYDDVDSDVNLLKLLDFAKDVRDNKTATLTVTSCDGSIEVGYNADTSTFIHSSWSMGDGNISGWVEVQLDDTRRAVLYKNITMAYGSDKKTTD
jgi:hypothetical protein